MADEQMEVPLEEFDRKIKWPKARNEDKVEHDHPAMIPDTPEGPFKDWAKDEEIGYEGER